jgi:hypothetical protein
VTIEYRWAKSRYDRAGSGNLDSGISRVSA